MTPRRYVQRRRAETSAVTREAVIRAAAELYRERGVARTTLAAVAERADVARGTIVNHFGGADGLVEAVLEQAITELEFPDEHAVAGATTDEDRIRRFVEATLRFFERSSAWWQVFAGDPDLPAVRAAAARYEEVAGRLFAATFGPLAGDRIVAAAVRAFVDYGPLHALRGGGLSIEESIEVVGDALVEIVMGRAQARPRRKGGTER